MRDLAKEAAEEVLEVVPQLMATIRAEMHRNRCCDISVPQFRTLGYLNRFPGASLSDAADYIGLTLPAMSRLVDGLVMRKLVTRKTLAGDRRRMTLEVTARGRATLESALDPTREYLAERFAALDETERAAIVRAMRAIRPLVSGTEQRRQPVHQEYELNQVVLGDTEDE